METKPNPHPRLVGLTVVALGVVFGDIGTSPLYALRECFGGTHPVATTRVNILGVLSLILWSLIILVSIKYVILILRADNKGEGGILALLGLAFPERPRSTKQAVGFAAFGLFGAALLYGDGMITPAISVLGAVEGLGVATPMFHPYILPITAILLVALFSFQKIGTAKVGTVFGPIMVCWFLSIAALGLRGISKAPEVLLSINPYYAFHFFYDNSWEGFVVLGAVCLCVTGAEALYADIGHFGARPIRRAWFYFVLPALILNYLGQGALLLVSPEMAVNPFYHLAPRWALYPLVVLATVAAIIASQALISGAFSITTHAIQLGYLPRLTILHTSSSQRGQIYLPMVNWILMISCIGLVLGFQSSSNLAAAYGIAVTMTMSITTVLFYFATQRLWHWSPWHAGLVCAVFFTFEFCYFGANALKIIHGGWFPIVVGALLYMVMSTWRTGRQKVWQRLKPTVLPFENFLTDVKAHPPLRVPGTAIFMSGSGSGTPLAMLHHFKHTKVLHKRVIVLTIFVQEAPHVAAAQRVKTENLGNGFWRVSGYYGFMEEPSVTEVLLSCEKLDLKVSLDDSTFFLSRETIVPGKRSGMMHWRQRLFALMSRNAQPATVFFRLPINRVVELGMQVEL